MFRMYSGNDIGEVVPVRENDMNKYREVGNISGNKEKELVKENARLGV